MKLIFSFFLLIFSLSPMRAQIAADAPKSKIIDAERLLRDLQTLSADEMAGRGIGTTGGIKAREYIAAQFNTAGIKSFGESYFQPFEVTGRNGAKINGANVVGYIEGKQFKDKYIVVSAHYDHLGTIKGEIYNGADDDASGTAALFAIAEYFKKNKPAHSIIFAAFDGEESGFSGSTKFIGEPPVKRESIALNINMDMIAHNDLNELYASGTYHYPALKPPLERLAKNAKVKLIPGHDRPEQKSGDWTNQSDHFVFHRQKIPFIYFGVEDHKDYHQPTDDFVNINRKFYVQAVETILEAVKSYDKDLK
ncbi:MAG: M20/M25/M40 family metallo-hydrolase [Pyrinomonadaceae bacterium]|nr:M20/M25/M40 family metallo-hydrolase [Pyrinomonadaceae bacterium]